MANENEPIGGFAAFWSRNSNRILIGIATAFAVLLLIVGGFWTYLKVVNKDVVATINGEKITKTQLAAKEPQYQRFFEHNKDTESLKNLDQVVKDKMVDALIIKTECAKRNITLTEAEISAEYKARTQGYTNEAAMLDAAKGAYGWDKDMLLDNIKTQLLKVKLEDVALDTYDVRGLYIRYDNGSTNNDTSMRQLAMARIQQARTQSLSGVAFESIKATLETEGIWKSTNSGITYIEGVDSANSKGTFHSSADWKAISAVNASGKYTQIAESEGYDVYYLVLKKRTGTYPTWEKFTADVIKNNSGIIDSLVANTKDSTFRAIASALGLLSPNQALACSATNTSCSDSVHQSAQQGHVYDSLTGDGIGGVVVDLSVNTADKTTTRLTRHNSASNCDYTFTYPSDCLPGDGYNNQHDSDTTHPTGYYRVGQSYTYVNGTGVTGTTSPMFLDCVYPFHKSLTKSGYETQSWDSTDLANDQMNTMNYQLRPIYTLTVAKVGSGEVDSPSGAIVCGNKCTNDYTAAFGTWRNGDQSTSVLYGADAPTTTLTAVPATGWQFTGWSDSCSGKGTCSLTMSADRNVTATFTRIVLSITTSKDAGCNILYDGAAASSPVNVNYGDDSLIFSGSANAGYTFNGFSIDGAAADGMNSDVLYNVTANHTITAKCTPTPPNTCSIGAFSASPLSGQAPLTTNFTLTAPTNATSSIINYGDGTYSATNPGTSAQHIYNSGGPYTANYSCAPGGSSVSVTINVSAPANQPPTVHIIPPSPADSKTVAIGPALASTTLAASITDPDSSDLTLVVYYGPATVDGSGNWSLASSTQKTFTHLASGGSGTIALPNAFLSGLSAGNYMWEVTGQDEQGNQAPYLFSHFVVDVAPVSTCSVSPAQHPAPSYVHATANISGESGQYTFKTLDSSGNAIAAFTDVSQASGNFAETINTAGNYLVRVTRGLTTITCTTGVTSTPPNIVTVTSSGSGGGGEVPPS